jgi:transmembrane sensor
MTKRKPSWFDPQLEQGLDAPAREAIAWFNRLRGDKVSTVDREAFAAWLQSDAAHATAFQEIEQLWRGLADMPETRRRRRKAVTRRTMGKGAVALLLAGSAWGAYRTHPFADYRTGVGERLTIRLPDGSVAQLSTSTTLSLDDDLATRRVILHAGEAFFEVAPDVSRPFVVDAGDGTVTALGTAFAVSDTDAGTVVTVTQHAVRIDAAARQMQVSAGMQATFSARGIGAPAAVDEAVALAWRQGRIVFVNARLDRVLDALNRWQSGRMVVLSSALAAHPVTLIVNLDDVADARRQLEDALPIGFTTVAPYLTLVHAR